MLRIRFFTFFFILVVIPKLQIIFLQKLLLQIQKVTSIVFATIAFMAFM